MFVKWKFRDKYIFFYDGDKNESSPNSNFSSAFIVPEALLSGIASLKMDKSDAVPGNYTCEVTELTREGETIVELKYRVVSWFSPNENILIVIFPMLAVLLFWGQFGIVTPAIGMSSFSITILILQVLGFVLSVVGLSLCVSECTPMHGPLLISGLGIIALAELLGLVYMKFVASNQRAIQPPRKAVEEPLNAFKESKGMMNDE
ncbi:leukocyte surface antigen CD47 isoform X6 [Myotis lucifugus]|uniref:leukocyte surface antigen CD47 isoform X6 n=1 Tax=Myotis lucifugus TaxID=59463 RepID=UPI000CCC2E87|nr:leukocyte surface antigen CD47 isoform X6 [Myotis lucifugus]